MSQTNPQSKRKKDHHASLQSNTTELITHKNTYYNTYFLTSTIQQFSWQTNLHSTVQMLPILFFQERVRVKQPKKKTINVTYKRRVKLLDINSLSHSGRKCKDLDLFPTFLIKFQMIRTKPVLPNERLSIALVIDILQQVSIQCEIRSNCTKLSLSKSTSTRSSWI